MEQHYNSRNSYKTNGTNAWLCNTAWQSRSTLSALIQKLFKDHNSGLLRFLTRKLSDRDEAADVAQSAYQKLMVKSDIDQIENPKSYLYQTAVNLAIDRMRKAKVRQEYLSLLKPDFEEYSEPTAPSPERHVEHLVELEQVNQAVSELPDKCQRAFLLHRVEHKSYREIAENLGVSVSMVEKYIIQALKHLRKKLR